MPDSFGWKLSCCLPYNYGKLISAKERWANIIKQMSYQYLLDILSFSKVFLIGFILNHIPMSWGEVNIFFWLLCLDVISTEIPICNYWPGEKITTQLSAFGSRLIRQKKEQIRINAKSCPIWAYSLGSANMLQAYPPSLADMLQAYPPRLANTPQAYPPRLANMLQA